MRLATVDGGRDQRRTRPNLPFYFRFCILVAIPHLEPRLARACMHARKLAFELDMASRVVVMFLDVRAEILALV